MKMVDVNRLFADGYFEFDHMLRSKEYNIRLYVSDALKNYYNGVLRINDVPTAFYAFLDKLIVVADFEVYHVLIMDDTTSIGLFIRLYNLQVEIAEKGYRNPCRMVPEGTILSFEQYRNSQE